MCSGKIREINIHRVVIDLEAAYQWFKQVFKNLKLSNFQVKSFSIFLNIFNFQKIHIFSQIGIRQTEGKLFKQPSSFFV